jgi:hypothetical protein
MPHAHTWSTGVKLKKGHMGWGLLDANLACESSAARSRRRTNFNRGHMSPEVTTLVLLELWLSDCSI